MPDQISMIPVAKIEITFQSRDNNGNTWLFSKSNSIEDKLGIGIHASVSDDLRFGLFESSWKWATSDNNPEWMSIEILQEWIEKNRDKIGVI